MAITASGYYGLALENKYKVPGAIWSGWDDPAHIFHKRDWNKAPRRGRAVIYKGWGLFEYGVDPTTGHAGVRRAVMPC